MPSVIPFVSTPLNDRDALAGISMEKIVVSTSLNNNFFQEILELIIVIAILISRIDLKINSSLFLTETETINLK